MCRFQQTEMSSVVIAAPFPPFSSRGGCVINKEIPFLSGAGGVLSKFQQK